MEKEGIIKYYDSLPNKDQLEKDFESFLKSNKRFQGKIKAGKTVLENIGTRYSITDKYEQLTTSHVFARCSNEETALAVEKAWQEYAKSKGIMVYQSDMGDGGLVQDKNHTSIVYVTTLKKNLFKCPIESCPVVKTFEGIECHKTSHYLIRKSTESNKLLVKLGKDKLNIRIEPISWKLKEKYPKECKYCEKSFSLRKYTLAHEKICKKNRNKRDSTKMTCPICNKEVVNDLSRHMWIHNPDDGMFTCPECGLVLKKTGKARHLKLHDPSQYEPCATCGKSIAKTSMKRHMTTHQPRKKICDFGRWRKESHDANP